MIGKDTALSENPPIKGSWAVTCHIPKLTQFGFPFIKTRPSQIAKHDTINVTLIFGCEIKGYERIVSPIQQSCCKPIVLSVGKAFEVIFWKPFAKCYRLIPPILESPQITKLEGGF